MPRLKNVDVEKREQWVMEQFRFDPRISGPEMNRLLRGEFKNTMRTTRIYELRDEVISDLATLGWKKDRDGKPVPPEGWVLPEDRGVEVSANRNGEGTLTPITQATNPLLGRCVVPVESVQDGVGFARKLEFMASQSFIGLKVEAVGPTYVVVSKE